MGIRLGRYGYRLLNVKLIVLVSKWRLVALGKFTSKSAYEAFFNGHHVSAKCSSGLWCIIAAGQLIEAHQARPPTFSMIPLL
jgi:hypothetical protein